MATTVVTRGISFSDSVWNKLQVAIENGYKRSRVVEMGLQALERERPEIFLPSDYRDVIKITEDQPEPDPTAVVTN